MISVVCWKWHREGYRTKFTGEHVNILRNMVKRNTTIPHRFICITDDSTGIDEGIEIVKLWPNPAPEYGNYDRPNCFVRLKAFSPDMKDILGEKFIWFDLDTVIISNIDHILSDPAEFKIWQVDGEKMPCNGSMVLHKTGSRFKIWRRFNPNFVHPTLSLRRRNPKFVGSDQAWIAEHLGPQDEFFGQKDGVYSFRCHVKPHGLKENACIVFFHGQLDPWSKEVQQNFEWVKNAYR